MKAWLLTLSLAVVALAASPASAGGHLQGPIGCTPCLCSFSKMHFHGPLVNYGPYPPGMGCYGNGCGHGGCGFSFNLNWNWNLLHRNKCDGCGNSWRGYSLATWKNALHRTHPCGHKAGCYGCGGCK